MCFLQLNGIIVLYNRLCNVTGEHMRLNYISLLINSFEFNFRKPLVISSYIGVSRVVGAAICNLQACNTEVDLRIRFQKTACHKTTDYC